MKPLTAWPSSPSVCSGLPGPIEPFDPLPLDGGMIEAGSLLIYSRKFPIMGLRKNTSVKGGRAMKLFRLTGLGFACLVMIFLISGESRGEGNWSTYKGAWFEIKYPPGFKVKPGQKSATRVDGYDSAYFVSPDHNVVFYVFSPQWQGKAREADVEINPDREVLIEQNVSEREGPGGDGQDHQDIDG